MNKLLNNCEIMLKGPHSAVPSISMTQGRGSFTMKFDRYEEAPMDVQQKVIEMRKRESEKE